MELDFDNARGEAVDTGKKQSSACVREHVACACTQRLAPLPFGKRTERLSSRPVIWTVLRA